MSKINDMSNIEKLDKKDLESICWREIQSIKSDTKTTLHHTLPKSRKRNYKIWDESGHIQLSEDLHDKFHQLFHDLLPHEQLMARTAINRNALSSQVKNILFNIDVKNFYDSNLER